jgi:polyferredoxin
MSSKFSRNIDQPVQKYRSIIQILFVLLCIWIGIEFYFFVGYLESNGTSQFFERPPGAEAFLPISSLMSIWYFLQTGIIHEAHPAGFFILVAVIFVSFIFGKSFCSWMCPVGTLSEYIADFGDKIQKKLFKRILKMPRWLDYPLRSLKYLLFGFFAYSIFIAMTPFALNAFLSTPYNIMADVKMWYFFAEISQTSIIVITVLFVLSIFIRNFWCRYLCPYGAMLGITSLLSPNKIVRNESSCIDCNLCAKACPSKIKVDNIKTVISDECSTCLSCIDACPVANTLEFKSVFTKESIPKKVVAAGIILIFVAITGLGVITGNWQNKIDKSEYLIHHKNIGSMGHPRTITELGELDKKETSLKIDPKINAR